jgi:alkanesulfonate monooxygenase SsuD/methylene tetrahydromethanopterin reductase-like flavin-dependent oxidoreductase (luciferase family)
LQSIGPVLRGERLTFAGRYHQVHDAVLLPPPDRPIPTLVAGNRPRLLRLTARYADAWSPAWYGLPDGRLGQRLAGMHAALQAENRDPATLRHTIGMDCEMADPGQTAGGSFAGPSMNWPARSTLPNGSASTTSSSVSNPAPSRHWTGWPAP